MITCARVLWQCAALLVCAASPATARTVLGNGKGLNMPSAVWATRTTVTAPAIYQAQARRYSPALVRQVADAGFGFVRLIVTPAPLMTDDAAARGRALDWIGAMVRTYRAAGLGVVVDLHFWPTDAPLHQDIVVPDPQRRAALVRGQVALARVLAADNDDGVALEIVNEPPCRAGGRAFDWAAVQRMMVARVRAVAPRLPLVLTGCRGLPRELLGLDAAAYRRDPNVYWTFHYYEPSPFIGQEGAGLHDVPFPPNAGSISGAARLAMLPPPGAPRRAYVIGQLDTYLRDNRGTQSIAADMAAVSGWARRQGVPPDHVLVGEFATGLTRASMPALRDDELRWLRAVREEAARQGFAWAWLGLPSPGDVNHDPDTGFIRPETLVALGLAGQKTDRAAP